MLSGECLSLAIISFLDKQTKKKTELNHIMRIEEKLNEISGTFDHSPEKSLRHLAQETEVSDFEFMLFPSDSFSA
jgi:hypothetical protein